jgi:biopolymer transport protein ExbB
VRLDFAQPDAAFRDSSAYANGVTAAGVTAGPAGVAGGAAVFSGQPLTVALVEGARFSAPGYTWSAWVRPASGRKARLMAFGPVVLEVADGKLVAAQERARIEAEGLVAGAWHHVAVAVGERLTVYLNGKPVNTAPVGWKDPGSTLVVGDGFEGELDAMALEAGSASAFAVQLQAAQGMDGRLLVYGDAEQDGGGEDHGGYVTVLMNSLTLDAKVVIVILAFMFAVAAYVMVSKAVLVSRVDRSNGRFLEAFEGQPQRYLDPHSDESRSMRNGGAPAHSSLARLYGTGMRELDRRASTHGRAALSAESVAAIKASIDSTLIRESQRLNRAMVLLTIAISGGPFLGLLGTVVGVMITFAAIAASGDVNINSIAPGIAAALLATVAGLGVAIPSLFAYNYLITRIKSITADMQAFSDEFITRMAEAHNA